MLRPRHRLKEQRDFYGIPSLAKVCAIGLDRNDVGSSALTAGMEDVVLLMVGALKG